MNEEGFMLLLNEHRDSLDDRRKFTGLLKDLMPGMPLQTNLLVSLFDIDIHKEIEKALQMDNTFSYRYIKRLCDEYGVSRQNAEWAVSTWCSCYGEAFLGKKYTQMSEEESVDQTGFINDHEPVDVSFDIVTNDYVDDWRNVYEYEIVNGGVTILKYIAFDEEEITVPETIESYPVIEIGEGAFENCGVHKIILPENIQKIGAGAFKNSALSSVSLPESLIEICDSVFERCRSLTHIDFSSRISKIGKYAFTWCRLNSVILPDGIEELQDGVFSYNRNLQSIVFPLGLKLIGNKVFVGCQNVLCVDILKGTKKIGAYSFIPSDGIMLPDEGFYNPFTILEHSFQHIRIPDTVIEFGGEMLVHERYKNGNIKNSRMECIDIVFPEQKAPIFTMYCNPGSEALKYARKHQIRVD